MEKVYVTFDSQSYKPSRMLARSLQKKESMAELVAVTALVDHPLRETSTPLRVSGSRDCGQTFRPDEPDTRAAFAVMMEDILLIKVKGNKNLFPQFAGTPVRFVDVRNDLPYLDTVIVCIGVGIMTPIDLCGREFRPLDHVAGVEALRAIRNLKDHLNTK